MGIGPANDFPHWRGVRRRERAIGAGDGEKAGLIREGVLRVYLVHPGMGNEPRDCFSYARVR